MASTASTTQIVSNNESLTIGQYNGFEIIVREKDGFINATKLVQIINEREHTNKQIKKIVQSIINHVRGTYVHKELLNIV
ncbi:MAG: hypothetical protein EZS28_048288, partial [Streblomastix strix]